MKRKLGLIGAALVAIGGGAHAQSAASIYGLVDIFAGRFGGVAGINAAVKPATVVSGGGLTTSFIGFRGREDLGGGAYAAFELSAFIRADTGAPGLSDGLGPPANLAGDPFFSRTSWVGLGHASYGSLRLGNVTTLMFHNSLLNNAFGGSTNFSPMNLVMFVGGPISGGTAWTNQIVYDSPVFSGFSFGLAGALAEGSGKRNLGAALSYRKDDLSVGLAWQDVKKTPLTFADGASFSQTRSWLLSGGYDMKWAKFFANVGAIHDGGTPTAPADRNHTVWSLSSAVPVGPGKILVGYASRRTGDIVAPVPATAPGGNISRRVASAGYDHSLSKRTDVYVLAMRDRTATSTLPAPPQRVDASATSFGVGVRHSF
ncbi:MAG: porin [Ramlibacter sp.]|nr:porin [Ramlibacter sp.]